MKRASARLERWLQVNLLRSGLLMSDRTEAGGRGGRPARGNVLFLPVPVEEMALLVLGEPGLGLNLERTGVYKVKVLQIQQLELKCTT